MNDLRFNAVDLYAVASPLESNHHRVLYQRALGRFNAARRAAAFEWAKSLLLGHARRLLSLAALPSSQVCGRHYGGIKCVNLSQICGSMNRTGDFDQHFHPLADRLRDRWVSVAMARSQDVPLPPVSLVQVGACYFVEDGHHRISVARAMGQTAIEAEVMGCARPAAVGTPTGCAAGRSGCVSDEILSLVFDHRRPAHARQPVHLTRPELPRGGGVFCCRAVS